MVDPTPPRAPEEAGSEPTPRAPEVGDVIDGRYVLREVLGEGGMGTVFAASPIAKRDGPGDLAIKIIRRDIAEDETASARFAREAMVSGQLDNRHIVRALACGELPGGGA
ncbi:MAG: hypothetical protein KC636_13735, partial [Myxococcales bacterium]|nr:hypothetical protein [Myxococcales bacterium]